MASPERAGENFGERNGKRIRNLGIVTAGVGFVVAPPLIGPGIGLAIAGEVFSRVSKDDE